MRGNFHGKFRFEIPVAVTADESDSQHVSPGTGIRDRQARVVTGLSHQMERLIDGFEE